MTIQLRRDNWNAESDKLVGDAVLKYMKNGGTQTDAFREVAKKLNRTKAAVAFRFNAAIRKNIENELKEAKAIRFKIKEKEYNTIVVNDDLDGPMDVIEIFTESPKEVTIDSIMKDMLILLEKNSIDNKMVEENKQLKARNEELESKLSEVNNVFNALKSLNMN